MSPDPPPVVAASGLGRRAVIDSAHLGLALGLSWILAFGGRLVVPRVLGEQQFGRLAFIESLTLLVMTLLALGTDDYIRTEVARDPGHALEFARPMARLRLMAGTALALVFGITFALGTGGIDGVEVGAVAVLFALGQLAVVLGQTEASYLHAVQRVKSVSVSAIASKLAWLVLLLVLLASGVRLLAVPIAMLGAEALRNLWLRRSFRRELGTPHRAPLRAATGVVRKSMPFYVDSINLAFTNYTVPIILGLIVVDREVGLLAAATTIVAVPLFFAPLLSWVLTPTFSRLALVDPALMWRRAREFVDATLVAVCVGSAVLVGVSTTAMRVLFGAGFADGGRVLAVLAVGVPATFIAMVLASAMICAGRGWVVTKVNLLTMLGMTLAVLVGVLVGRGRGPGGPALGAAVGITAAEWATAVALWPLCSFGRPPVRRVVLLAITAVATCCIAFGEFAEAAHTAWTLAGATCLAVVAALEAPGVVRTVRDILRPPTEPEPTALA